MPFHCAWMLWHHTVCYKEKGGQAGSTMLCVT